ncbi:MAG: hypothetical protein LIP11_06680 [Clostridiales bacterium]|nr:hypothetical protein [Clostridiales bacterium]
MIRITSIDIIENRKHIALLDASSISFMQGLKVKGIEVDSILADYDVVLIPEWVFTEISEAEGRTDYVQELVDLGFPIYRIAEEKYTDLVNNEEGNLYQIVLASTYQIGCIKSYLRRYVEKDDLLDMEAYREWINKLYDEWPIPGSELASGRIRKKNAGEVSITILAEVISWYYPETESLTIYSQDSDTYEFQRKAEESLKQKFNTRTPISVSYKSNDAILFQLFYEGKMNIESIGICRKDMRKMTYSKEQDDHSIVLVTEAVDNDTFIDLIQEHSVHIIF